MVQLGFDLIHDLSQPSWWMDIFRSFFAMIDQVVYSFLSVVYQILFTIAKSQFLSPETIKDFYGRVQLIIGIFMIFKLTISLLQVVVNPELMTDKKKGFGQIITRIVTMLAMFTAIIPLNIPNAEAGSYNAYLNDNGLLFGTLYSLQDRILDQNILAKLVLGSEDNKYSIEHDDSRNNIEKSGEELVAFLLKGFIRVNTKDNGSKVCSESTALEMGETNLLKRWVNSLPDWLPFVGADEIDADDVYKGYNNPKVTRGILLQLPTLQCDNGYAFAYSPIISTACGVIIIVILIGFCVDIAVRTLKLAVLRLMAPIPILSYVDPQSAEKGSFAAWTKSLIVTYLDLFIRLLIVFFAIFCVQEITTNGIQLPVTEEKLGVVSVMATIFIIIGIFFFVKMAPKFIIDALGLKGMMSNIGLSSILAAAGAKMTGGNFRDSLHAGLNAANAQTEAFNQGKAPPRLGQSFNSGRDYAAQMLTGNEKMTYQQMKRGRGYLANEGITDRTAENQKKEMFALQDEQMRAQSTLDQIHNGASWNDLSAAEKRNLEEVYRNQHGIAEGPLSLQQQQDMEASMQSLATENLINKKTAAGKAEAKYKDMQAEMQKWGLTENYRGKYNAKRNTRLGDVYHNFDDVFSEGKMTGIKNVFSAPGNTIRSHPPANIRTNSRERRADRANQEFERQERINSTVEASRRQREKERENGR